MAFRARFPLRRQHVCVLCMWWVGYSMSSRRSWPTHTHTQTPFQSLSVSLASQWAGKKKKKATHPTVRAKPDFQGREACDAVWQPWSSAYPCKAVTARTCCSFLALGGRRRWGHEAQEKSNCETEQMVSMPLFYLLLLIIGSCKGRAEAHITGCPGGIRLLHGSLLPPSDRSGYYSCFRASDGSLLKVL